MKNQHKIKLLIIVPLVLVLFCSLIFISQIKFGSINIPRIIYATIVVNTGKEKYVIVKDNYSNKNISDNNNQKKFFASPHKVIVASPNGDYDLSDYAESIGYNIVEDEQYGAKFVIEKDDDKEEVLIFVNQYYSLWQWY